MSTREPLKQFAARRTGSVECWPQGSRRVVLALCEVAKAAQEYRSEEQADTPRMYRGKKLHDLGCSLSDKLDALDTALEEALAL